MVGRACLYWAALRQNRSGRECPLQLHPPLIDSQGPSCAATLTEGQSAQAPTAMANVSRGDSSLQAVAEVEDSRAHAEHPSFQANVPRPVADVLKSQEFARESLQHLASSASSSPHRPCRFTLDEKRLLHIISSLLGSISFPFLTSRTASRNRPNRQPMCDNFTVWARDISKLISTLPILHTCVTLVMHMHNTLTYLLRNTYTKTTNVILTCKFLCNAYAILRYNAT